jgi:hypothetical protein
MRATTFPKTTEGDVMVKTQSTEEVIRERLRSSLEAFLEGKKDLNWIKRVIVASEVFQRKGELQGVFDELRAYKHLSRYQEILEECQREGWL